MRKNMHAKTLAIVLATTTALQLTGMASQLVNGEAFVTANAATVSTSNTTTPTATTMAAVQVTSGPGVTGTTTAQVTVATSIESECSSADMITLTLDVTTDGAVKIQTTTDAAVTYTNSDARGFVTVREIGGYILDQEYTFYFNVTKQSTGVDKFELCSDLEDGYKKYMDAQSSQYEDGAIATFKTALVEAEWVAANDNATQQEVYDAIGKLKIARITFDNSKITETGDLEEVAMPSAVIINGTERVGRTLTAKFLSEDASEFATTTTASVKYEWYRLSSKSSEPKLVGEDRTYDLVSSDNGKYIKLVASYDGKTFEDITSSIDKRSSSSSSSSSSSDETNSTNDNSSNNGSKAEIVALEKNSDGTMKLIENGQPVIGWKQVNGAWYLANPTGIVQTGWQQTNGAWYLLNNDGAMATGWQQTNGTWYLLNGNGAMATGWQQANGAWYLLKDNGAMATGWQKTNGKWYYLYSNGSMASNTAIDGYNVDASGAWI